MRCLFAVLFAVLAVSSPLAWGQQKTLAQRLATRVTIDVEQKPLAEIADLIGEKIGASLVVDPRIPAAKRRVNFRCADKPASQALSELLAPLRLKSAPRCGCLLIGQAAALKKVPLDAEAPAKLDAVSKKEWQALESERIKINFGGEPLDELLTYITRVSRCNIILLRDRAWPQLDLRVRQLSAARALTLLAHFAGAELSMMHGACLFHGRGGLGPAPSASALDVPAGQAPAPWRARLADRLARTVTLDFEETPLADVLQFLQEVCGANIVLHPDSRRAGQPAITVSVRLDQQRIDHALALIERILHLDHRAVCETYVVGQRADLVGLPREARPQLPAGNPARATWDRLRERTVGLDFSETPLPDVVEFINLASEADVVFLGRSRPAVSFALKKVSSAAALTLVAALYGGQLSFLDGACLYEERGARRPSSASRFDVLPGRQPAAWQRDIAKALARTERLEFRGRPLIEVLGRLAATTGVDLLLHPQTFAGRAGARLPVALRSRGLEIGQALALIERQLGLDHRVICGAYVVGPRKVLERMPRDAPALPPHAPAAARQRWSALGGSRRSLDVSLCPLADLVAFLEAEAGLGFALPEAGWPDVTLRASRISLPQLATLLAEFAGGQLVYVGRGWMIRPRRR